MNRTDNKTVNVLDPRQQKYGGMDTPAAGSVTDIKGFSLMRGQVLSLKLDKMSDSIGGQTVVDPRGFLTDLNSLKNPDQVRCRLVGHFCNFPLPMSCLSIRASVGGVSIRACVFGAPSLRVTDCAGVVLNESSFGTVVDQAEIGDIKKARLLLKSMITTNPKHGLGWIAAARLEAQVTCSAVDMHTLL